MKNLLFLLCFCVPILGWAQPRADIGQKKEWVGDTAFWYKLKLKATDKLQLQHLAASQHTYHLRYWRETQLVEIYSVDGKSYDGFVTDYIETYNHNDWRKRKPTKLYFHTTAIDPSIAREISQLANCIRRVPIQDSIAGWESGKDGSTYIFELSTLATYLFKEYWTPESYSTILEARQILEFTNKVEHLLELKWKREEFREALPTGASYYNGGTGVLLKRSSTIRKGYKLESRRGPTIY